MSGFDGATAGAVPGTVYLVGAGPGDPGLITVRAIELIASADAILHDRLIPETALDGVRDDAITEFAGKGPSGDSKLQSEIEARMVELARAGKSVVRLKGGDPFVFGRGGEEAATLASAGIPFEVVPGVTAGIAASAYAGVPVTHRDHAGAVAFVTGQENPDKHDATIDWPALAAFPGTLVFYMGVRNLPRISQQLIAAGRDPKEPVAVIARGTTPRQQTVTGTLDLIAAKTAAAGIEPPALTVIGPVTSERERIQWFEKRPLFGRTIAVTRARERAGKLATRLRLLGANVIEAPAIQTHERDDGAVRTVIGRADEFGLICFTSSNGVEAFFSALRRAGHDVRRLSAATKIAAIGAATAETLRGFGILADLVPARATAEGLLDDIDSIPGLAIGPDGRPVLLAVATGARPVLREELVKRGATVEEVAFYDTIREPLLDAQAKAVTDADFITFASGSAVDSLIGSLGSPKPLEGAALISIGPTTSGALRDHGLEPTAEATRHDIDGLIETLLAAAQST